MYVGIFFTSARKKRQKGYVMSEKKNTMRQREKAWEACVTPDKRVLLHGLETLTDSELLALVIRSGTKDKTAVAICAEILDIADRQLLNLHALSLVDLVAIDGIGKVKALQLKAVAEIAKRLSEAHFRHKITFDSPGTIADYYMERLRHEKQEHLFVSLFDAKGHFLEDSLISKGTSSCAVFSAKEIYCFAIRKMASFVVILHNHPSGNPMPSENDTESTERIADAGDLLSIPLLDHIIIGDRTYFSYRESGLLK